MLWGQNSRDVPYLGIPPARLGIPMDYMYLGISNTKVYRWFSKYLEAPQLHKYIQATWHVIVETTEKDSIETKKLGTRSLGQMGLRIRGVRRLVLWKCNLGVSFLNLKFCLSEINVAFGGGGSGGCVVIATAKVEIWRGPYAVYGFLNGKRLICGAIHLLLSIKGNIRDR